MGQKTAGILPVTLCLSEHLVMGIDYPCGIFFVCHDEILPGMGDPVKGYVLSGRSLRDVGDRDTVQVNRNGKPGHPLERRVRPITDSQWGLLKVFVGGIILSWICEILGMLGKT
jgi:hypothetical protein